MINRDPVAEVAAQDEIPADRAAAAGELAARAAALAERAERERRQAEEVGAAARAQAQRIIGEAEAAQRVLTDSAAAAERESADVTKRARWLGNADIEDAKADEAGQLVSDLEAERADLAAELAEIDSDTERLRGEHQAAAGQRAAARERADVDAITTHRSRGASLEEAMAGLNGKRAAATARLRLIGNGTAGFPGELLDALNAAERHRAEERRLTNLAFPDSAQARHDALRAELAATLAANIDRLNEENAGQQNRPGIVTPHGR